MKKVTIKGLALGAMVLGGFAIGQATLVLRQLTKQIKIKFWHQIKLSLLLMKYLMKDW
ncbi:hypothetical protein ACFDD0_13030 [Enterococcus lactis]|uniref:hypothetical protein n=1 Tax=Enterococcus lactis TaxID=357441 RepID=UPI0039A518A8